MVQICNKTNVDLRNQLDSNTSTLQTSQPMQLSVGNSKFNKSSMLCKKKCVLAFTFCSVLIFSYLQMMLLPEFSRHSNMLSKYQANCNRTYGQIVASEWKSFVAAQPKSSSGFNAAIYARWLAYSNMEWYKKDHVNYTPNASVWDYCMNGSEYCVISYSMYATDSTSLAFYLRCLLAAREGAEIFYPGWRVRVYYDSSISPDDLAVARSRGVETIHISYSDISGKIAGMFWRFFVADDASVDRYIVRDLDSQFNWRERAAVDEWILSNRAFHIMRDNFYHSIPMMGGMWGGTKGNLPFFIQDTCHEYSSMAKAKGGDQDFLALMVWPEVKKAGCVRRLFFAVQCCNFDSPTTTIDTSLTAAIVIAMIHTETLSQLV